LSWGKHHIFGENNLGTDYSITPRIPLNEIYVEPSAKEYRNDSGILETLNKLIDLEDTPHSRPKHRCIVVAGDFGYGKSLSSKMFAIRRTHQYVNGETPKCVIRMNCAEDCKDGDSIMLAIQSALFHAGDRLGLNYSKLHKVYDWSDPESENQKTIFIVDGLDEAPFTEEQLNIFFRGINSMNRSWQFVVFTRSPILAKLDRELQKGLNVINIDKFNLEQVDQWLQNWDKITGNKIGLQDIEKLGLKEDICIPILLFMIAASWKDISKNGSSSKSDIYTKFFMNMARGKLENDEQNHPNIYNASKKLRDILRKGGIKYQLANHHQADETSQAMLWLMSRISWEYHCKWLSRSFGFGTVGTYGKKIGGRPTYDEFFSVENIRNMLGNLEDYEEIGKVVPEIVSGALLSIQANNLDTPILYGHKSFREYLVSHYWESELLAWIENEDSNIHLEHPILQEDLMMPGLGTVPYDFLEEKISNWSNNKKDLLCEKIQAYLSNNKMTLGCDWFMEDKGYLFKNVLFGLYGFLKRPVENWKKISNKTTKNIALQLKLLIAWKNLVFRGFRVNARYLYLKEINLQGMQSSVDFSHSDLSNSFFAGALTTSSQFIKTILIHSNLTRCDLNQCDFSGANLEAAFLSRADATNCYFRGSNLRNANLVHALLVNADLTGASLEGADLYGADLSGAYTTNFAPSNKYAGAYPPDAKFITKADLENKGCKRVDKAII
jgi:hypothetical protein